MHREFPVYNFPVASPAVPSDPQQRWFSHDIGTAGWSGMARSKDKRSSAWSDGFLPSCVTALTVTVDRTCRTFSGLLYGYTGMSDKNHAGLKTTPCYDRNILNSALLTSMYLRQSWKTTPLMVTLTIRKMDGLIFLYLLWCKLGTNPSITKDRLMGRNFQNRILRP